ncbi:MAG: tetratricopeptide repeat protein, partial [Tepidisphaeraceae bacterium]
RWTPVIVVLATLAVLWIWRRRLGRGPLAAGVVFVLLLSPMLGLVNYNAMRNSYVFDHVQYLASGALLALAACAIVRSLTRAARRIMPTVLLICLSIASMSHAWDYRNPLALWNSVLSRDPRSTLAHNSLGAIELSKSQEPVASEAHSRAAEDHFRAALTTNAGDVTALMNLGHVFALRREPERAIGLYYRVLALQPDSVEAMFALANSFAAQGDSARAGEYFVRVLDARPDDWSAHLNYGQLLAEQGEVEQAVAHFQRCIAIRPRGTDAYINLANVLFQNGAPEQAFATLLKATELDPRNAQAFLNASGMAGEIGRLADAERLARHALFLNRDSALACDTLGIALAKQGHSAQRDGKPEKARGLYSEAVAYFRRGVELAPENQSIREHLDMALQSAGTRHDSSNR